MTPTIVKNLFEARQHAVTEYRALDSDITGEPTAEQAEGLARIDASIRSYDERIASGLQAIEAEQRAIEAVGRLRGLPGPVVAPNSDADQRMAILAGRPSEDGLQRRAVEFNWAEARDLSKGTASAGGNLVPTNFVSDLYRRVQEASAAVMSSARIVRTASGSSLQFPRQDSYSTAAIIGEGAGITESDPAFGLVTLGAFKYAFAVQVPSELLADEAVGLESFLSDQGGWALGHGMGAHFIAGTGSGQPQGVVPGAAVTVAAAGASAIAGDDLINLLHGVPSMARERGVFVMRDATLSSVRKLKDSTGQYLWQPGLAVGQPDTLLGRPVYTDPAVPVVATTNRSVVFGDMGGYIVRLAGPVRVERSDEFAFVNDLVTYRFIARADGRVLDQTAIAALVHP